MYAIRSYYVSVKNIRILDVAVDSPETAVEMLGQAIPVAINKMKENDPGLKP